MNAVVGPRLSVFRWVAMALAALYVMSFPQPTVADPTRFAFTLFTTLDCCDRLFHDGGGWFVIDDPIPANGTVVLVASDLAGTAGEAEGHPAPFGYEFGNTFEYFVGPPPEGNISVTQTPHEDALVTFRDGVAVGISYSESHTCDTGHHCESVYTSAGNMSMYGTTYRFQAGYAILTGGPIIITQVPEPGTQALLLAGFLALLAQADGWRRRCTGRFSWPRTRLSSAA
jgi:hypothetical protein